MASLVPALARASRPAKEAPLRGYHRDLFSQLPNERLLCALAWLAVTAGYIPDVAVGQAGFRAPTQQHTQRLVAPHQQTTDDEWLHWVS